MSALAAATQQGSWPLVGRAQELAYVAAALEPPARGVLLAGSPGVGKTRLAQEALARAAADGRRVVNVAASPATADVPFGVFAHLLAGTPLRTRDRSSLLAALAHALLGDDGPARLVVGVDDVHVLDELSAALVHHLAVAAGVPVVLTGRSGEPVPAPLTALYQGGYIERLEVQQLAFGEVHELLMRVLDGEIAKASLTGLWELSAGNALYLRELVLDARDAGTLVERDGVWRWRGGVGRAPRLTEVVGARLAGVSAPGRELLELLAVGEPLDVATLERLGPGADLAQLERHGLVEVSGAGRRSVARLAHPIYGEVLRAQTGAYQRRRLAELLADDLQTTGMRRSGDILRLSLWRVESGTAREAEPLTAAAAYANRIHDAATAETLARVSQNLEPSSAASVQLGVSLVNQGRFAEAVEVLRPLVDEPRTDPERKTLAYLYMRALFYGLGRPDEALELLARLQEAVEDPAVRTELVGWRAMILSHAGRFPEAAAVAAALLASPDPKARLAGLPTVALGRLLAGRARSALELAVEWTALAGEPDPLPTPIAMLHLLALLADGQLPAADELAERLAVAAAVRRDGDIAVSEALRGHLCLMHGRPRSALQLLRDAAQLLRDHDAGGFLGWCLSQQVQAAVLLGDAGAAQAAYEECQRVAAEGVRTFAGATARGLAWLPGAHGAWSRAAAELAAVAERLVVRGETGEAVHALHDALRLGAPPALAERLVAVAAEADGRLAELASAHARAARRREPAALLEVASDFAAVGLALHAADAAAAAAALAPSSATRRRAAELAAGCEGARTPALATLDRPPGLTRREREVADLAAAGLSNRDIAERLVTSQRTVESHLQQVYAKLGINSRAALAGSAARKDQ